MNTKIRDFRFVFLLSVWIIASCSGHRAPSRPSAQSNFNFKQETGYASWYGDQFHGKKTASGTIYDMDAMTAAHRYAPFGTRVRVTNLETHQQTIVTITDRGPFVRGRIIDLSRKAARDIGMIPNGTAKVSLEFLDRQPVDLGDVYIQVASFEQAENAGRFMATLQQELPTLSPRIYNENGLYRVRIGPYPNSEAAAGDLATLKRSAFGGFILHP